MAILEFHQVSLFVGDLEKALRFYRDALGCLELARLEFGPEAALPFGLAPRAIRTVVLARAGMQLELVAWAMAQAGEHPQHRACGRWRASGLRAAGLAGSCIARIGSSKKYPG